MAKLVIWRRWRSIALALVAALCSFLIGQTWPWNQLGSQATQEQRASKVTQTQNQSQDVRDVAVGANGHSPLRVKPNDAFEKVIERLQKEARLTFSVPVQFRGKTIKEAKLGAKEKVIALTFDDGPWPKWTEQILNILKKNDIKATFFMVGQVVEEYPQLAKRVVDDGHAVANHTWTHPYRHFNEAGAAREIDRTSEIIYKVTGAKTSMFRPPGGYLTNGLAAYAQKQNYVVAMWSSDSIDYRRPAPARLARNALRNAKPGGIVLMHDGGGDRSHTVQALPIIIKELRNRGYKFVTLPELLEMQDKEQQVVNS